MIPDTEKTVCLEWAFQWMCPNCNYKQYTPTLPIEFTYEEIRYILGLEDWEEVTEEHVETSRSFTFPATVSCKNCHTKFNAIGPDDEYDDEYDEDFDDEEDLDEEY